MEVLIPKEGPLIQISGPELETNKVEISLFGSQTLLRVVRIKLRHIDH